VHALPAKRLLLVPDGIDKIPPVRFSTALPAEWLTPPMKRPPSRKHLALPTEWLTPPTKRPPSRKHLALPAEGLTPPMKRPPSRKHLALPAEGLTPPTKRPPLLARKLVNSVDRVSLTSFPRRRLFTEIQTPRALAQLLQQASSTMERQWQPDTHRSRNAIVELYRRFMVSHGVDPNISEEGILAFLQDMISRRGPSGGVYNYGRWLRQLLKQGGNRGARITAFLAGLTKWGCHIPRRQAPTFPTEAWRRTKEKVTWEEWMVIWTAAKTASRVSEVLRLTGAHIHPIPGRRLEFAVDWLQTSKRGMVSPFDIVNKTHVVCREDEAEECRWLTALPPSRHIAPHINRMRQSTAAVRNRMRKAGMSGAGSHSLKRTSARAILQHIVATQAPIATLPRLLKHKHRSGELVPSQTVRYVNAPELWAQVTETGALTAQL